MFELAIGWRGSGSTVHFLEGHQMARMPVGQPRSVPDEDREAYNEMIRRETAKRQRAEVAGASRNSVGHPGFAESLIPVWGSGREALADLEDGDYAGAALNGALAASDVFLAGALLKAGGKTAMRVAARAGKKPLSTTWNATGKRMRREGYIPPEQQGHHWLIPRNGWGKSVPEAIKNAHWNIYPRPAQVHKRIHYNDHIGGKPRFNTVERFVHGTPPTAKVVTGSAVGHPVGATKARLEEDR